MTESPNLIQMMTARPDGDYGFRSTRSAVKDEVNSLTVASRSLTLPVAVLCDLPAAAVHQLTAT